MMRTAEMGEENGANAANETVIEGELSCVRESMEVLGVGRGSITFVVNRSQVY
jgi:hypothetical protein